MAVMQCNVVCKDKLIYSGVVTCIIAKGLEGEVGIYPNHIPFITFLKAGPVRFTLEDNSEEIVFVSGGFLEVQPQIVTVLADSAIRVKSVEEALRLANEQQLKN